MYADITEHCGHQETELYYNGLKHGDVIGSMDNGIHRMLSPGSPAEI